MWSFNQVVGSSVSGLATWSVKGSHVIRSIYQSIKKAGKQNMFCDIMGKNWTSQHIQIAWNLINLIFIFTTSINQCIHIGHDGQLYLQTIWHVYIIPKPKIFN